MKTLYLHGPRDLRLVERELPRPSEGQALLRVKTVGLCGSDLHWYEDGSIGPWKLNQPIILGHELAAVVQEGARAGQRVAADPAIPCERCEMCRQGMQYVCPDVAFAGGTDFGGLTEYALWPADYCYELPDAIDDVEGAMLEPLGVAMHAVKLHPLMPGMRVGVFGCGPIGLLLVHLARLSGATCIFATDKLRHRLDAAARFGATDVCVADGREHERALSVTRGKGVDVAFEAAGDNAAVSAAVRSCGACATVIAIGIGKGDDFGYPASAARHKELTIVNAHRMNHMYQPAIGLALSGKVDLRGVVSHRFPLDQYAEAFDVASRRAGLKVIIDCGA